MVVCVVGMVGVCVLVDTIFISGSFKRLDIISINLFGKTDRVLFHHDERRSKDTMSLMSNFIGPAEGNSTFVATS